MHVVTAEDVRRGVHDLGVAGRPVVVHSSLRSFGGRVEGGAQAVIDAFLKEGCTLIVPTFTYRNEIRPPEGASPERNALEGERFEHLEHGQPTIFSPERNDIFKEDMGAIPAALLEREGRVRGNHPIDSFTAAGPLAAELIGTQTPEHVYGPLYGLAEAGGWAVLIGVDLNRLTLIHAAEQRAGRELFVRWALGPDGDPLATRVGGCSEGFPRLEPALTHLTRETTVGQSRWRAYPATELLGTAAAAIRAQPTITHCDDPGCLRCRDAILGGPIIGG